MSAVIGALRVNLGIDTAAFTEGLKAAQDRLASAGKSLTGIGQSLSLKVTAPLALAGGLVLRTAGDFEAGMNRVQAALGASSGEMGQLTDLARDLGKSTTFSAREAADAIETLAKNGLATSDILGGALSSSLALAASSGSDLAGAADLATDIMLNFKKGAGELSGVVDGVSGVLLASKFGFDDYRLALAQAGGVAGGLGVTLEDFNAVIAATSSRFASGSDAGTSFKTFLQRLVPGSKAAAEAIEQLGLSFFDSDGNMRSMAAVAQELQDALSGLNDEAKSEALSTIFGTDAMRTAIGLMEAGSQGIQDLDAAISSAKATDQAAARTRGFNGALEQLSGAVEELQLAIADSGLLEMVTGFVQGLTGLVDQLSQTDPEILKFGTIVASLAAALGPLAIGLGFLVSAVAAIGAPVAAAVVGIAALAAGAAAVYANWDELRAAFPGVTGAVETGIEAIGIVTDHLWERIKLGVEVIEALLSGDFAGAWAAIVAQVTDMGDTVARLFELIFPGVIASAQSFATDIGAAIGQAVADFRAKVDEMAAYLNGLPDVLGQAGRDMIDGLLAGLREKWEAVKAWFAGLAGSIPGWIRDPLGIHSPSTVFAEIGGNVMQGLAQGLDGEKDAIRGGMESFARDIAGQLKGVLTGAVSAREALGNILGAAGDQLLDAGINGAITGIFGSLGIPGFASGTHSAPGGIARINEYGGELVNLPSGAQVIPHDLSRRMIDGRGEGGLSSIAVSVSGARGNAEINQMVQAGVANALREYDARLADRMSQIGADPRFRG